MVMYEVDMELDMLLPIVDGGPGVAQALQYPVVPDPEVEDNEN